MLIAVAILVTVATFTTPLLSQYQIRNDLAIAKNQITQGLSRAKLNAIAGKNDDDWSFYVPEGVLFKGGDYASRDQALQELYPMPSTIKSSGLAQVTYSSNGKPDVTGTIVLRAANGDVDSIEVVIDITTAQIATTVGDTLTICHNGTITLSVPDNAWPPHQAHGDAMGPCTTPQSSSSSVSSAASSMSSASSSSSSSFQLCPSRFTFNPSTGVVTITANGSIQFKNIRSHITWGQGGPQVPVHACQSDDNGQNFSHLFGGNGSCKGNGIGNGNAVAPDGTDIKTLSFTAGEQLVVRINGKYKQQGWLVFDESYQSNDQTNHVQILRNGDVLALRPGLGDQVTLKNYLLSKSLLDAQGKITVGACNLLVIAELDTLGVPSADFDDDVMQILFQ